MRKWVGMLAAVSCLTACGSPGSTPASETSSTPTSSTPTSSTPTSTNSEHPAAPDFTLALGEGGEFTLSAESRPVFMVFWAEW